ncbi:putative membrane protein [Gracilibacillus halotolerans]|uniref:Putative membrane protein n=1 Tax=Gracilibacillus halotolerans TaxID=74386 RepID=A0A841RS08_9BACI|nr:phage holin family protein [Gracilibacillus halotolerans]MBB6513724.1 putative membrane protein [Gracilibacillus halotolerans]
MRWIASLVLNALALMLVDYLFEGFTINGFWIALLASVILAVLNTIVKPILVLLTLPITVLTLGLFLFVINAITLMFTQALLGEHFVIEGWFVAIIAAVVLSILNVVINKLTRD